MQETFQKNLVDSIDRLNDEGAGILWCMETVKDIQGTIRAIDAKMGILLAALAFPIKDVSDQFIQLHGSRLAPGSLILTAAVISYALAIFVTIATVSGIGASHMHIQGAKKFNTFYAGGLFKFKLLDSFFRRGEVLSSMSVSEFARIVPTKYADMIDGLSEEIISLAYIRDLKILRQRMAFILAAIALLLGAFGSALTR
jgi:hypothetical protein